MKHPKVPQEIVTFEFDFYSTPGLDFLERGSLVPVPFEMPPGGVISDPAALQLFKRAKLHAEAHGVSFSEAVQFANSEGNPLGGLR